MSTTFGLKTAHYIRGRLRLKVETDMNMRVFFIFLHATIKRVKEIKKAQLNHFAASVTLYFDDGGGGIDSLIAKLSNQMDFIIALPNFNDAYGEILNAVCFGDNDDIEIIVRDGKIALKYLNEQTVKRFLDTDILKKENMISTTTVSAGLFTLLLAPALPTPAWLVLLIFGYSSFKQYESAKAIEQLLVQYLKPEKQETNE